MGAAPVGQVGIQRISNRLSLALVPESHGYKIEVRDGEGWDLALMTPPMRDEAVNPRMISGWHFRSADNSGPNTGDVNAPQTLLPTMAARKDARVFFAGQLAGTEGYIENVASGLVAGINAVQHCRSEDPVVFPEESAIGSLCRYVSTPQKDFAPMNIHFGLLPPMDVPRRIAKADKQRLFCERALASLLPQEHRWRCPA